MVMTLCARHLKVKLSQNCRHFAKWSYFHQKGDKPLLGLTFGKVLENAARKYPDTPAVISRHQKKTLTFSELLLEADKFAVALRKLGLKKGDRVGIWGPNSVEWETTSMACSRAGLILVQLNPAYQAHEMEYCINKVGMKALVCDHKMRKQNFYDVLNEIDGQLKNMDRKKVNSTKVPSLESIVVISNENLGGTYNFNELIHEVEVKDIKSIYDYQNSIDIDDGLNIQFTSGTTGNPKATLVSHFNVVNNSFGFANRLNLGRKNFKVCVQVPFFHTFGATAGIVGSCHYGTTLVLPDSVYNPEKSLEALSEEKCDIIYGTPTMYVDLINQQKSRNLEINPEIACIGASPTSPQLINDVYNILKIKSAVNIYGMTEATCIQFLSFLSDSKEQVIETVGQVMDHTEVKVVDEKNAMVPFGTAGELCVRGYPIMKEYYDDEAKTKEILGPDGWLKTGDKFVLYENGFGKIVGRIKDMIDRGGENIFPKEVEDFVSAHPDINECQVIGLPHERLGEEVCACVTLKPGATLNLDQLVQFCKGKKVAYYKIPSKLFVMDSFPKTQSGKIQKFKLVQELSKK